MLNRAIIVAILLSPVGCGVRAAKEQDRTELKAEETVTKPKKIDGGLTELPTPKYLTFNLCKSLAADQEITDDNADTVTQLCTDDLISDLRKPPQRYDGSGLPDVYGGTETVDDDEIEIAWFESVVVHATAKQVSAMERLRLTDGKAFAGIFKASEDLTIEPLAESDDDQLKILWNNARLGYLPQEFKGSVSITTLSADQAYVHQWTLDESVQATQSFTRLVIINQIGLNTSEVLTYTRMRSEAGGDPTVFKARTYDGRREMMTNLYENGPFAYKVRD